MDLVVRLVFAVALVLLSAPSWAQLSYFALIDSDNNSATGCVVTLPTSGTVMGIERRLVTTVSESTAPQVTQLTLESCIGGSFGPPTVLPGAPYTVGSNNGANGADVVEQAVDANLIAAPDITVRFYFAAQGPGGDDLLGSVSDPPILLDIQPSNPADIPFLSGWGSLALTLFLLVMVFRHRSRLPASVVGILLVGMLAGIAWAAGFHLDGQVNDWQAVPAVGSDAQGDSAPNTDIVMAFAAQEGGKLFFRTDIANAATTPSSNQAPVFTSTPITAANVANPYSYAVTTSDPNSNALTLTAPTLPAWLIFTPGSTGTGTLSGTPGPADLGPHAVILRVTDNGTPSLSTDQAFTITVGNATNPAPILDLNGPAAGIDFAATFIEDGGAVAIVDPANLAVSDPDSLNLASATLTITNLIDSGQESLAVSAAMIAPNTPITAAFNAATGVLTLSGSAPLAQYRAALRTATYNNTATAPTATSARTITFVASDGSNSSAPATATVTVTSVNDAPSFTAANPPAVNEDSGPQTVNGWVTAFDPGATDESAQTALAYTVSNVSNAALFSTPPSVNTSGNLGYTPAPNAFGTATFQVQVQDSGGTANGGQDTSAPQTFTITVNGVNDQPGFTASNPPAVNEDAGVQTVAGWATFDPGNAQESAQAVLVYTVSSVSNAALFSAPPSVATNGNLTYTPAAGANGTSTFSVTVRDNGGTANGGVDTSAAQTFTITVTAVDDPPTAANDTANLAEDAAATAIDVLANDTDPDGGPKSIASVQTPSANGGTVAITNGGADLTYQPAPDYCNTPPGTTLDTFTYTLTPGSSTGTVTVTVNCANDAPVVDLNGAVAGIDFAATFTEGGGAVAIVDAVNLTVADVDNSNLASATVMLTNRPDGAVESLSANTAGTSISAVAYNAATGVLLLNGPDTAANFQTVLRTLIYNNTSPDPDTTARSITVVANDGAADSAVATSTVTVNSINSAPSFTKGADQTVLEDAGAQTVNPWATAISDGDGDTQTLTFNITNNTNPGLFSAGPAISAAGVLTYTPAANANGSTTITVTLSDDGSNTPPNVNTSAPQSFTITVSAINDAPSFTAGPNQTVNEDAGAQTVNPWATAINDGDGGTQTLTFNITGNTNASLFSAGPAISAAGVLTYTPAANANGSATITVTLSDNGGTANSGVDTSAAQTFTITVNAVNDAPSFTAGSDQTVDEDAGAQTVPDWATSISAGPANEAGQTLNFNITGNTNPSLFGAGPAISSTGVLTYTSAANANGSATITVTLSDNGSTANGGVDTSASQTFTITVNAVNDPPVAQPKTASAQANMKITGLSGLLTGVTDPDINTGSPACNPTFTVGTVGPTTSPTGGTISNVDVNAGTFDFDPPPGVTGAVTFNYTVVDSGCGAGGPQTSAPATITVNVSGPVIWFVDPAAGTNGNGTLASSFNSLASANTAKGTNTNHRIFVYSGTTAAGTGVSLTGDTTQAGAQWLIGQGASGASFDALMGISPPLGTIARPGIGGTRPTIQGTLTLNGNNVKAQGFNLTTGTATGINDAAGAISGVNVSEVSVTSTTGTAVNLSSLGGTISLTSVSANGGANGIVLDTTTGSFTVTGDGSNTSVGGNSSGGTIANMVGADGATSGIGVYLNSAQNVTLRRMTINGTNQNFGIRGFSVNGFALEYSTVGGTNGTNGTIDSYGEGGVYFGNATTTGLTGTGTVTSCTISGSWARNFSVVNTSGTLNRLTITGTTFGLPVATSDNDSLAVEARNNGTVVNVTVTGSTFTGAAGDLIDFTGQTGTTMDVVFQNNTLSNNHPFNIIGGGGATLATQGTYTFNTSSNGFRGANGSGITLQKASAGTSLSGTFNTNTIGVTGVTGSGSASGNGLFFSFAGGGTITSALTNNQIRNYSGNAGIFDDNTGGTYAVNLTMTGNTAAEPGAGAFAGLALTAGAPSSSDAIHVCAQIGGAGASQNDFSTGDPSNANDIILGGGASGASSIQLPGLVPSGTEPARQTQVQNFVLANNNVAGTAVTAYVDSATFASTFVGGAACPTPP